MNKDVTLEGAVVAITGGSGFIGTNLIDSLSGKVDRIANLDLAHPLKQEHESTWLECDVLDRSAVLNAFREIAPTHVLHLAARTDMEGKSVHDYRANTEGVANVLAATRESSEVERSIWVSTQFVCGPEAGMPTREDEYGPHTIYGESKVLGERLVREAGLKSVWTIVRPTNIWGPWHPRYPSEFWRVLKQGRYFHPGHEPVIRSYGYVGTVVSQMQRILTAPAEEVNHRVLYVGDEPVNLRDWCDAFSDALTGRPVRVVPRLVVRALGRVGDLVRAAGVGFPIFSSRVRSMTNDYPTPMEPTFEVCGPSPYSLEDGVNETVRWLREQDPFWT